MEKLEDTTKWLVDDKGDKQNWIPTWKGRKGIFPKKVSIKKKQEHIKTKKHESVVTKQISLQAQQKEMFKNTCNNVNFSCKVYIYK